MQNMRYHNSPIRATTFMALLMQCSRVLLCLVCLLIETLAFCSQEEEKARMHMDLRVIENTFQTQYAPLEWKSIFSNTNIAEEFALRHAQIDSFQGMSIKDYQRIIKQFFDSMQDYHVGVSFFSTEAAQLPFLIKSANGRYYLADIDRHSLPPSASAIQIGDEILTFNGEPIFNAMQQFLNEEFNAGKTLTDQALGELFFTLRLGSQGHLVPNGPVWITIKHQKTQTTSSYELTWNYHPEEINAIALPPLKSLMAGKRLVSKPQQPVFSLKDHPALKKSMLAPLAEVFKKHHTFLAGDGLGSRQSFLPPLGKKVWESSSETYFHAYIFENVDRHRIGYIRIPHYSGSEKHILQFKSIIKKFNTETDALVIDQVNNPGGSVFYMYALVSMLSNQPLLLPKHRISLTQGEIAFAVEAIPLLEAIDSDDEARRVLGDTLEGVPVDVLMAQQILSYFYSLTEEWNAGYTFTKPLPLWGFEQINPHPGVQYKKPIIVLINQLDISCGDFFPAILQDNNRALLFGSPTAGAGGYVLSTEYPNLLGIERFTYTGSIAYREDDAPIENLGVHPDVYYTLTEDDLTNRYAPYLRSLHETMQLLFK